VKGGLITDMANGKLSKKQAYGWCGIVVGHSGGAREGWACSLRGRGTCSHPKSANAAFCCGGRGGGFRGKRGKKARNRSPASLEPKTAKGHLFAGHRGRLTDRRLFGKKGRLAAGAGKVEKRGHKRRGEALPS